MEYNGVSMQCDGDTENYPYLICTCTIDYVSCSDSAASGGSEGSGAAATSAAAAASSSQSTDTGGSSGGGGDNSVGGLAPGRSYGAASLQKVVVCILLLGVVL